MIAHPSCSEQLLEKITDELSVEAEHIYKALEALELKQKFLAATTIFQILKNEFNEKEYTFIIDYIYNNDDEKCDFQQIILNDGNKNIKNNHCSKISLNVMHFLDYIEDNLMNPKKQNIIFFNDDSGRHTLLSTLMGNDYQLWQSMALEQQLPEKNIEHKKLKI